MEIYNYCLFAHKVLKNFLFIHIGSAVCFALWILTYFLKIVNYIIFLIETPKFKLNFPHASEFE